MGYISSLRNNVSNLKRGAFLTLAATLFVGGFFVLNIKPVSAYNIWPIDTTLTVSSVTATYGDTISLSATLEANGSPLSGKTINFKIKSHDKGSAITDADGIATLNGVSLVGIDVVTDDEGVYAKFNKDDTYQFASDHAKLTITPKPLTISGITAEDKVYNRNKSATVDYGDAILNGILSGDSVNLNAHDAKENFSDWNVGSDKTIIITGLELTSPHGSHEHENDYRNYSVTAPTITAEILPKSLTISSGLTPNDKEYNGTTAATLVGSPTLSDVIPGDDVTLSVWVTGNFADKNVGNEKPVIISGLTLSGADSGNYILTQPTRTANITARLITVTADPKSKSYGAADPALTYQITAGSLVADDSLSGGLTRVAGENAGTYAIRQGDLANGNYAITYAGANLTIVKSSPVIVWNNPLNIIYGTPLDLINHLNAAVAEISGNFAYNPAAGTILDAGESQTLATVFTPDDATNYEKAGKEVLINVGRKSLTVSASASNKTYDGTVDASVTLSDDRLAGDNLNVNYTAAKFGDPDAGTGKTVTVEGIAVTGPDSDNYALASGIVTATADILPRPLTIVANSINKFFGQELIFAGTEFTAAGLVGNDQISNVMLVSQGTGEKAPIGDYDIFPSNAGGIGVNNYTITYSKGTLTVNEKLNPAINWPNPAAITYGTALDANQLNATASYGEIPVDGTFAYTPDFGTILEAGSNQDLSVTFTPSDAETYNSVSAYAKINVRKNPITVTADPQTKIYGEADPDLTYQITGGALVPNDALSGALTRAGGENVDSYPIEAGNLSAGSNYELDFIGASLTINPRDLTITAKDQNKTVGQKFKFDGTEFTASGDLIDGDTVSSVTLSSRGADEPAAEGAYPITPSAAVGSGMENYRIIYVEGVLTVNQKLNPVIVWENPADILYGTALDSVQLNAAAKFEDSALEGSYNYAPAAGTVLGIGNEQNLSVEFTPTDGIHYNSASAGVSINVIKPSSYNVDSDELPFLNPSQALIPKESNTYDSTPTLTASGEITINVPDNGGTSRIIIPAGTVISGIDGGNINGATLTAADATSGLSGLGNGVVVDGALQWGITSLGLQFSQPITLKIFVGNDFNGQTLNVMRSVSGSTDWTTDGISPATCTVADGYCGFTATKASYYAITHTVSAPILSGNYSIGGGGGGGSSAEPDLLISAGSSFDSTGDSVVIRWQTSHQSTSYVIYAKEGERHALDLSDNAGTPPKYGYERTTPEYDSSAKVLDHIVALTGLEPNTTYYYRMVSHGSLAISDEQSFTTKPAPFNNNIPSPNGNEEAVTPANPANNPEEGQNPGPLAPAEENTQPGTEGEKSQVGILPSAPSNAALLLANIISFGSGKNWVSYLVSFAIYLAILGLAYQAFVWFAKYRKKKAK